MVHVLDFIATTIVVSAIISVIVAILVSVVFVLVIVTSIVVVVIFSGTGLNCFCVVINRILFVFVIFNVSDIACVV